MNALLGLETRPARAQAARPRRRLRPLPVALAAAMLMAGGAVDAADSRAALPGGLQIIAGQASVATNGSRMTVTNTNNTILNWQSFSVGQGSSVTFNQPNASSQVLNRVVGSDPSNILGQISSNGKVWLLNPYGVLFGASARVDVGGLVTSTLNIGDADFQAGRYSLFGNSTPAGTNAAVVNQGELRSTGGGQIMLIGGSGGVRNEGVISTRGGQVVLAAGSSVELVDTALPNLAVKVSAPQGQALNLGQIVSTGGRIDLLAAVVNQQGIVRADGVAGGHGGDVVLTGSEAVNLAAGSQTTANGAGAANGGTVSVDAGGGSTLVGGAVQATAAQGVGGTVTLLGRQVGLLNGAAVDASGASGGGSVYVGGGLRGRDPGLHNADAVYFDGGAQITADATGNGNGGRIVLWSDHATRAYGALSARGGATGGDGGFIETSGGWLDARPASVRTGASTGHAGQWLLDPDNITITDNTSDIGITGGPDFSSSTDNAVLSTATIVAALNANNNVSITTGSGGENAGDIKLTSATITPNPGSPVSLSLNASRNIVFDFVTIRTDGAPLDVNLNAATSGEGAVAIRSSSILTRGGNITIGGQGLPCGPNACDAGSPGAVATDNTQLRDGISIQASALDAGSGNITMVGHSTAQNGDANGVAIIEGSTLSASNISISGIVDSDGDYFRTGVKLAGGTIAATNSIHVDGTAYSGVYQPDAYPVGVDVLSPLRVDPAFYNSEALLSVTGTVFEAPRPSLTGVPVVQRFGVGIRGASGQLVATNGAAIDIAGDDGSSNGDYGIYAAGTVPNFIDGSQASSVRLDATGGLKLTGQMLTPDGGPLSLTASGLLSIDAASISGNASSVLLSGQTVEVGISGQSTQLVFGESTSVDIEAQSFRIGTLPPSISVGEGGGGQGGGLGTGTAHALDFGPVATGNALVSTGGTINVSANSVEFGPGAVLASAAFGDAITMAGFDTNSGISNFVNTGGANVLATPNGRWLVYAVDSDNSGQPFQPGALQPDFKQYGIRITDEDGPAAGGNAFLFSAQPVLSLSGTDAISKVYDGTTSLDLNSLEISVTGLRTGETLVGGVQFSDKNVATGKSIIVTPAGQTGIVDANGIPVYGYQLDSERMVGDITPRTIDVGGITASDKRYDGTNQAAVSWTLNGLVSGDNVRVQTSTSTFADALVGNDKTVSAALLTLGGSDAGNYVLGSNLSATGTASITPATLSYVANPVNITRGDLLPSTFTGSVTGFVGTETLATATTGTLAFGTTAAADADPGRYAINGSGLSAGNYVFVQAPSNAVALTISAPLVVAVPLDPSVTASVVNALAIVSLPTVTSSPQTGRALDAVQAVQPNATGERSTFSSLDLDKMSLDSVAAVLAAREQYKKSIFSVALSRLEIDPSLADAPGCATPEQAATGQCLITAPLPGAGAGAISNAKVVEQGAVAAPTPGSPATAVAPAGAGAVVAASPARAPSPPVAKPDQGAADAALAALPQATLRLPAPRPVLEASVPQIGRKIAVVIGIDQYSDDRIPKLANAVNDARAIGASLEAKLGYQTVVLENPTRTTIFRTLNQLSGALSPNDSVVLYYAGHGELVEKTGVGYWQPADADPTRPETWISNTDIGRMLRQLPAQQVAMISDSCFSGSLVSDERIRGTESTDPAPLLAHRATVVMSSGGNEPVFDSGKNGHSPFAWSLMQSLDRVSTWKPGSSIFEQVRFDVARQLPQRPQYGASRVGGHEAGADYVFEQRQLGGVTR
jgi:filamentous hemagglutinin family protein